MDDGRMIIARYVSAEGITETASFRISQYQYHFSIIVIDIDFKK